MKCPNCGNEMDSYEEPATGKTIHFCEECLLQI